MSAIILAAGGRNSTVPRAILHSGEIARKMAWEFTMAAVNHTRVGARPDHALPSCARAALLCAVCLVVAPYPSAAGGDQPEGLFVLSVAAPAGEGDAVDAEEQEERERVATAMVYVVVGIAVVGIALIVLIILGGHRMRQRARTRAARAPDLDPLWYLKHQARTERAAGGGVSPAGEPTPPERHDPGTP